MKKKLAKVKAKLRIKAVMHIAAISTKFINTGEENGRKQDAANNN